jgi:LmbE family N-acetylglucosaminyl deacetylase
MMGMRLHFMPCWKNRVMTPAPTSDDLALLEPSIRQRAAEALLAAGRRWSADTTLEWSAPACVFAPHPDDEVLGCGGTIALKTLASARVQVAVMTDGRTSHARFVDAPTLIQMRRAEAIEASRSLGLDPSCYTFLDCEDNRLADDAARVCARVCELLERHRPDQVFVPHRRDRLADHVATYQIVTSAVRECGRRVTVLEYPVWLWNNWPWTLERPGWRTFATGLPRMLRDGVEIAFGCHVRVDVRSVLLRKREALERYRSQMQRRGDDPRWPVLADVAAGTFLERFYSGVELFRPSELGGA